MVPYQVPQVLVRSFEHTQKKRKLEKVNPIQQENGQAKRTQISNTAVERIQQIESRGEIIRLKHICKNCGVQGTEHKV